MYQYTHRSGQIRCPDLWGCVCVCVHFAGKDCCSLHCSDNSISSLQDVLVICQRPWTPFLTHLVKGQPQSGRPRQCSLVHGHICIPVGAAHAQVVRGLLSCGFHFHHWALHLLCYSHCAEDHIVQETVCEGRLPPWLHEHSGGYCGSALGCLNHGETPTCLPHQL